MRINIHPKIIWIGLRLNKLAKLNGNVLLKQSYPVATRMILPLAFYILKITVLQLEERECNVVI
jgi:hypothetical protein